MKVDLIKFLSNGNFGTLTLGDSIEKVIQNIGKPIDESIESLSNKIYKYGNIEFTFGINDEVACIYIENENSDFDDRIHISNYNYMKSIKLDELKEIFLSKKVKIINEVYIDKNKTEGMLKLNNFVKISFYNNIVTSYSVCDTMLL
jgi:hypothetical protein